MKTRHYQWFAAGLAGVIAGWTLASSYEDDSSPTLAHAQSAQQASTVQLTTEEARNIAIFQEASPSVVFITGVAVRPSLFSMDATNVPAGTGSGLVWDTEGHIITNYHVIHQANVSTVTLTDQTTWPAELVGVEPDKDLAVLKIEAPAEKLRPLRIGTSTDLKVGQAVYAIGNPFGLDQTLTTGIISGLGRQIQSITQRPIRGVIQTDAAINPGNSGGPLLNSSGAVIGINTAMYSPSGASSGIGFAVPIDIVKMLVPQILELGHARRAGMGVILGPDHLSQQLRIPGIIVTGVAPGTPAETVFKPAYQDEQGRPVLGDVITHVDGKPVRTSNDLYLLMDSYAPGDTVTVRVLRGGEVTRLDVTLTDLGAM